MPRAIYTSYEDPFLEGDEVKFRNPEELIASHRKKYEGRKGIVKLAYTKLCVGKPVYYYKVEWQAPTPRHKTWESEITAKDLLPYDYEEEDNG